MLCYEFLEPDHLIATREFSLIRTFLKTTGRTQIGWHYVMDLAWILSRVKHWPKRLRVLDAGGGIGPLQFLLAEMGFHVTNIDLVLKPCPQKYQRRYRTTLTHLQTDSKTEYEHFLTRFHLNSSRSVMRSPLYKIKNWKFISLLDNRLYNLKHNTWRRQAGFDAERIGRIDWKVGNLCHLNFIETNAFDAVVSLSALEHIPLHCLGSALAEIRRTVKQDGRWAVTTSGTEKQQTWFHRPSRGYCFTSKSIEEIFQARPSRRQDASAVLQRYRQCAY